MAQRRVLFQCSAVVGSGTIQNTLSCSPSMKRQSIALFLSTLALTGGVVGCGKAPEAGEEGGDEERKPLTQPGSTAPSTPADAEGGEGGEGGEG